MKRHGLFDRRTALAYGVILFASGHVYADDAAPAPPPTAIEIRIKDSTNANLYAAAEYGPPASGKPGDIAGADKAASLALMLQPSGYDKVAARIVTMLPQSTPVLLTSRTNLGSQTQAALDVLSGLRALSAEGAAVLKVKATTPIKDIDGRGVKLLGGTVPAMLSMVGALDSIIALFRADYGIAGTDVNGNQMGLLLAVQRRCADRCRVDGVDLLPSTDERLERVMAELASLRMAVAAQNPEKESRGALFLQAVDATVTGLRTPGPDGLTPLSRIHALLAASKPSLAVAQVTVLEPKGTAVTSKRMFSRNHRVHLYFTALVNVVVQSSTDVTSATLKIGESAVLDMREVAKGGKPLSIATDGVR